MASGSCRRRRASPPRRTTRRTRARTRSRRAPRPAACPARSRSARASSSSCSEHQVGETAQDAGAFLRRPAPPSGSARSRGLDRAARLGRAQPRHLGDRLARRRVEDREGRARVGVDPASVDVAPGVEQICREAPRGDDSGRPPTPSRLDQRCVGFRRAADNRRRGAAVRPLRRRRPFALAEASAVGRCSATARC